MILQIHKTLYREADVPKKPPPITISNEGEIKKELWPIWPDAGRALGFRSRAAAYAAVRKGRIKIVKIGNLQRVPRWWIERKIAGDEEAAD